MLRLEGFGRHVGEHPSCAADGNGVGFMMFLTVEEAEALVADRQERLERAEQMDRPGYVKRCRENVEAAVWRLRHAKGRVQA